MIRKLLQSRVLRALTFGLVIAIPIATAATGCAAHSSAAPTSAQCAAVVGNGEADVDRSIHHRVYPGQQINASEASEVTHYFVCGARNFKINDGTVLDANGKKVGDRHTPTKVWSQEAPGKPKMLLDVWSSSYWTPDQGAFDDFYFFCQKYHCYTTDAAKAADANYSEPGWNGMLGENFGGTVDLSAIFTMVGQGTKANGQANNEISFTSDIVNTPSDWVKLGDNMAEDFRRRVRSVSGFSNTDLFCGSGTSGWKYPDHPGEKQVDGKDNPYTCSNIRIVIDWIQPSDPEVRKTMAQNGLLDLQDEVNRKRVAQAKQLYGDRWAIELGVQDAIEKCKQTKDTTCVVNIGNGAVTVPTK